MAGVTKAQSTGANEVEITDYTLSLYSIHPAAIAVRRRKMVSTEGFEPPTPGFIPLRLSPPHRSVRGLDCPFTIDRKGLQVLPIQSLHLPGFSGLGSGSACCKRSAAFPDFEQIRCVVSVRNAQFSLGILCSILLSYVDISIDFLCSCVRSVQ